MESIYHIIVDKTRQQIDVTTPVECRQNTYASFLITAAFTGMIHLLVLRAMLFLFPRDDCRGERVAVPVEIVRALTTELSPPLSCRTSAVLCGFGGFCLAPGIPGQWRVARPFLQQRRASSGSRFLLRLRLTLCVPCGLVGDSSTGIFSLLH
jgi:hypothetical protein